MKDTMSRLSFLCCGPTTVKGAMWATTVQTLALLDGRTFYWNSSDTVNAISHCPVRSRERSRDVIVDALFSNELVKLCT